MQQQWCRMREATYTAQLQAGRGVGLVRSGQLWLGTVVGGCVACVAVHGQASGQVHDRWWRMVLRRAGRRSHVADMPAPCHASWDQLAPKGLGLTALTRRCFCVQHTCRRVAWWGLTGRGAVLARLLRLPVYAHAHVDSWEPHWMLGYPCISLPGPHGQRKRGTYPDHQT